MPNNLAKQFALLPYLIFFLLLAYYADNAFVLFDFPVDDAWIHRVYARALSLGQGMAYNEHIQETGFSSPLWVIITAPAQWLEYFSTNTVVLAVKTIGCCLALSCLAFTYRIALFLTGSTVTAFLASCLFALEPRLMFSALSGMEPILFIALLLIALDCLLHRKINCLAICMGLAVITRPEAILFLPFFALIFACYHRTWQFVFNPRLYVFALGPLLGWLFFCYHYTGYWLPNTFYAKASASAFTVDQLTMAWEAFTISGWGSTAIWYPGLLAFLLLANYQNSYIMRAGFALMLASCLFFSMAIMFSRNMALAGYYWTRWVDPAVLLLTSFCCIGFARLLCGVTIPQWYSHKASRFTGSIIAIIILFIAAPALYNSLQERKFHLIMDARAIHMLNVNSGIWINKNTPANARIAVNDAGGARYFGNRYTVDLLGLNNHSVLHNPNSIVDEIQKADYLVVFPSWLQNTGIGGNFTILALFELPLNEYTICPCPTQTQHAVVRQQK